MSNLSINMTGPTSAQISFSADQNGDHLTAGCSVEHTINIADGDFLRRVQGDLFRLQDSQYEDNVALKFGDAPRMNLDKSLWSDLADALFAFVLNVQVGNLVELNVAA